MNEMSLIELAKNIRSGRTSSEEYVAACNVRIERYDQDMQAWAWYDPRQALDAARLADKHARNAASRLPLGGVPIAIKDIIDTAGMPTEIGSPIFRGRVPDRDAFVVERLKQLGAVIMGKTVTTEFAWSYPGKTHNPWNTNHTPGGSSSGSAAVAAAGFVPAALGTQTMGSIIRPAAFCGVVGFKPSYGLISRRGIHPFAGESEVGKHGRPDGVVGVRRVRMIAHGRGLLHELVEHRRRNARRLHPRVRVEVSRGLRHRLRLLACRLGLRLLACRLRCRLGRLLLLRAHDCPAFTIQPLRSRWRSARRAFAVSSTSL